MKQLGMAQKKLYWTTLVFDSFFVSGLVAGGMYKIVSYVTNSFNI